MSPAPTKSTGQDEINSNTQARLMPAEARGAPLEGNPDEVGGGSPTGGREDRPSAHFAPVVQAQPTTGRGSGCRARSRVQPCGGRSLRPIDGSGITTPLFRFYPRH